MDPITQLLVLTALAGAAIPLGGAIASVEKIGSRWLEQELRHTIIAFGGGALLSAVALVLIPEGIHLVAPWQAVVAFAAGGFAFWGLQVLLNRSRSSASQLVAMLADFVPEVIALGAVIASGERGALLLAAIITMQNLPEGFNSYRELLNSGMRSKMILLWFMLAALLGPILGAVGYVIMSDQPILLGWMQLFAAAGILYLVFEDIAPQAMLKNSSFPPLGAVLGFLLGLAGKLLQG